MTEPRRSGPRAVLLHTALLWGDFVVALDEVHLGQSVRSGPWSTPSDAGLPAVPVRGHASGWEVDTTGADEGVCRVGGTERAVEGGERVSLVAAGDTAVLRYGEIFLCAHVERRASAPPPSGFFDPLLIMAGVFAAIVVLGGLALAFFATGQPIAAKPSALQRPDELARAYYLELDQLSKGAAESGRVGDGDRTPRDRMRPGTPVAAALDGTTSARKDDLSPHDFGGTILSHYAAIESCAPPQPSSATAPERTVRVELTVAPSGVVQAVRFLGTELGDDVVQCVGDQLRRFEFPVASAETTTRLTIRLGS